MLELQQGEDMSKKSLALVLASVLSVSLTARAGSVASYFEMGKIIGGSALLACVYGVLHDLIAARMSKQYFLPPCHPPRGLTEESSPNEIALRWGIEGSYGWGTALGTILAMVSQYGQRSKLTLGDLIPGMCKMMAHTGLASAVSGIATYLYYNKALPQKVCKKTSWTDTVTPCE